MKETHFDWGRQVERVGALADPVRRSLYELAVASEPHDLSRDQAAQALGIRRGLAAFHLDKLVELGLLETRYRRPPGIGGPGAGRPTKFYRRSTSQIDVSLPPRRYDLIAKILAEAVADHRLGSLRRARNAGRRLGRELGALSLAAGRRRHRAEGSIKAAFEVLVEHGYEPVRRGRQAIILRNCPFQDVARAHQDVICQVNLALHQGLVEYLAPGLVQAALKPEPSRCCVTYQVV